MRTGIKGINAMARKLGVSRQVLSEHAAKPGAPAMDDVDGWSTFFAMEGQEGSAPPDVRRKIADERLKLLTAKRKREEVALNRDERKVILTSEVEDVVRGAVAVFFAGMERLYEELPSRLKGMDETGIQTGLRDSFSVLKERLKADLAAMNGETT